MTTDISSYWPFDGLPEVSRKLLSDAAIPRELEPEDWLFHQGEPANALYVLVKGELDLGRVMTRRLTVTGSTLRPRPVAVKGEIADSLRERVWPLFDAGKISPVIHQTFPLAEASRAHELMESSSHIGKIILSIA